jgi:hypothetical protein
MIITIRITIIVITIIIMIIIMIIIIYTHLPGLYYGGVASMSS